MASDAFIKFYPFEAGLGTEGMDTVLNLLAEPQFIALKWIANDIHSQLQSDTSAAIDHLSSLASHKEEDKKMILDNMAQEIVVALPGIVSANIVKLRQFLKDHPTISHMPAAATDKVIDGFFHTVGMVSEMISRVAQRFAPEVMNRVLEASPSWKAADKVLVESEFTGLCRAFSGIIETDAERFNCAKQNGKVECEAKLTSENLKRACYWVPMTKKEAEYQRTLGQCTHKNGFKKKGDTCKKEGGYRYACNNIKGCKFMPGSCGTQFKGKCGNLKRCQEIKERCQCFKDRPKLPPFVCEWHDEGTPEYFRLLQRDLPALTLVQDTGKPNNATLAKEHAQLQELEWAAARKEEWDQPRFKPSMLFFEESDSEPRWELADRVHHPAGSGIWEMGVSSDQTEFVFSLTGAIALSINVDGNVYGGNGGYYIARTQVIRFLLFSWCLS